MNRDKYGIIGQRYSDGTIEGGDSASWMGQYVYLTGDDFDYVGTFEVAFGGYVRHPHPHPKANRFGWYYKNAWMGVMSRDQTTGVLLALVKQKQYAAVARFMLAWALRGFVVSNNVVHNGVDPTETKFNFIKFFYNPEDKEKGIERTNHYHFPDFTLFDIMALALRGFGVFSWLFFPLLCILDVQNLLTAIHMRWIKKEDEHVMNLLSEVMLSREIVPTPTSWVTAQIIDQEQMKKALTKYWCGWRDNCEFVALFEAKMKETL